MEPMELDEDSPTLPQFRRRQQQHPPPPPPHTLHPPRPLNLHWGSPIPTTPTPNTPTSPFTPSTNRLALAFPQSPAASSPACGFSQLVAASPYKRVGHAALFRSASFDLRHHGDSLASLPPPLDSSRPATPGVGSWRGAGTVEAAEGASFASMETSDRSDVSEMEVVGNSPSPHREAVRSALHGFSFFTQTSQGVCGAEQGGEEHEFETSQTTVAGATWWEPALSTVQAAGKFRNSHGKRQPSSSGLPPESDARQSSSESAPEDSQPAVSVRRRGGEVDQPEASSLGGSSLGGKTRPAPDTGSSSKGGRCCGCGVCVVLLAVVALLGAVIFQTQLAADRNFTAHVDEELLRNEMASKVFGQHIAMANVADCVRSYLAAVRGARDRCEDVQAPRTDSSDGCGGEGCASTAALTDRCQDEDGRCPAPHSDQACTVRPLVLSFHGWTGVGKNFVSDILTGLFPARTVTRFLVPFHFPHHHLDQVYRGQVEAWVLSNVTRRALNFFVFDEMDKATPGVIAGVESALSRVRESNSFLNPSIFLFLSNSLGADINRVVFEAVMESRDRESLTAADFAPLFESAREPWYLQLQADITASVPFLPLARQHVVQCIRRDLVTKKLSTHSELVERVLQELLFTTLPGGHQFSQTGCKRVSDKVNLVAFD